MPLADRRDVFAFPALATATYLGLPATVTVLDRLTYMGKRGMGALEFQPARGSRNESATPVAMKALVEEARRLVEGSFSVDRGAKAALANIIKVGTSAGGARAKAVIAWNPETDEARSGQFEAAPGFEHWLLKFDGVGKDKELGTGEGYVRIEYAYSLMAKAAGITMSPCRMLEENGRAHFMTRRFDREVAHGETRIHHVQTLCSMSHLDLGSAAHTPTRSCSWRSRSSTLKTRQGARLSGVWPSM